MSYRRILVAVRDLEASHRGTFSKVAALAAPGARIELFHVLGQPVALEALRRGRWSGLTGRMSGQEILGLAVAEAARRMQRWLRRGPLRALRVHLEVSTGWPIHAAITERARTRGADLVVAETRAHRFGARLFLGNTDWELIRHSPCPLLLTRAGGTPWRRPTVLASLDPFHAEKPASLDAQLLATARGLARHLGGSAHAFHAFMPLATLLPVSTLQPMPLWMPPGAERRHERNVRRVFERLARAAGVAPARRHLCCGAVADQLAEVVRRSRTQLVVMGAVSRSGLERLFIGNTAERVLDGLPCDVLIEKPRRLYRKLRGAPAQAQVLLGSPGSRPSRRGRTGGRSGGERPRTRKEL